jgi:hypothetical protein
MKTLRPCAENRYRMTQQWYVVHLNPVRDIGQPGFYSVPKSDCRDK